MHGQICRQSTGLELLDAGTMKHVKERGQNTGRSQGIQQISKQDQMESSLQTWIFAQAICQTVQYHHLVKKGDVDMK